jgi:predicted transcriptional regulator
VNDKNKETLDEIKAKLEQMNKKLDVLLNSQEESQKEILHNIPETLDLDPLLSLPDHLRKTFVTVTSFKEATAAEVGEQTKRTRALESSYLNQLVMSGYLKKERIGRKVYFCTLKRG